jgi:isopentenyl-diphosphate delta-isomerase type 1
VSDDPVVLVDEGGAPIGQGRKSAIHHDDTPLHLAFSCYVLDPAGRLLVTTRAASKPSFPGVVTNTVCGHPTPGEDLAQAVRRRARSELGVEVGDLRLVLPEFRYQAQMNGIVENEVCPVFVGWATSDSTAPDPEEVDDVQWVPWEQFRDEGARGSAHRIAVGHRAGSVAGRARPRPPLLARRVPRGTAPRRLPSAPAPTHWPRRPERRDR